MMSHSPKFARHGDAVVSFFTLCGLVVCGLRPSDAQQVKRGTAGSVSAANVFATAEYGKLPLSFVANRGQADPEVRFTSRGDGYELFLTGNEAVLWLARKTASGPKGGADARPVPHSKATQDKLETESLRMQLVGAREGTVASGQDALPGTANYFLGNDASKWRSNIPTYGKVRYEGVYKGVDLLYYGNQRQLEYDFVVAPQADPGQIQVHFGGARRLELNANGDLEVIGRRARIAFNSPVLYQQNGKERRSVTGRFTLLGGNSVGFSVGSYDRSQPLVIDPVLSYSTFLSGSGASAGTGDLAYAVAADADGDAYVAGEAFSTNFPVTGSAYKTTSAGFSSNFVSKLNAAGTALIYSTYIGGTANNQDAVFGIAVDASGNAYITGDTFATDYPVTASAFQKTGNGKDTGFVTKLNSTGTALVYSTYLGGTGHTSSGTSDQPYGLAIDSSGNAYITGYTISTDFPVTAGAFQTKNNTPYTSADFYGSIGFVTKLNSTGSALIYSTYLGGTAGTSANAIAIDTSGNAYITGGTHSTDHPVTTGAWQTKNPDPAYGTCFVTKLNPTGTALVYSTYLGGSGLANAGFGDEGDGIAVDTSGNAYVAGATASMDFPVTKGAYQTTENGLATASATGFVTKLNATGDGLVFSTYLGGSGQKTTAAGTGDLAGPIAVDASGNVFVGGNTLSSNFPVTSNAYQHTNNDITYGVGFVSQLSPTGTELLYSTYFGGSAPTSLKSGEFPGDTVNALALDAKDNLYIAGATLSTGFPAINGAFQTTNNELTSGGSAAFVAKFNFAAETGLTITPSSLTFPLTTVGSSAATQVITLENSTSSAVSFTAATTITGPGASSFAKTASTCANPLAAGASCTNTITFTLQAANALTATVTYTDSASSTPQTVALSGTGATTSTGLTITPGSITFPSTTIGSSAAAQTITLKNSTSAAVTFTATTTITGRNASSFTRANTNCTSPLAAGASCTNVVTFTPQSAGTLTATVTYTDSASTTPQTVALSGTGASAATGLTITPSSLMFPSTTIGTSAATQTITLKNSTSAAVTFTATTTLTGTNASSFSRTNTNCTSPLAAGASCTNVITFTPQSAGALTATVTYTDSASSTPETVALSGTGASASAGLTITPSSLTFPSTTVGSSAATQVITLKNSTSAAVTFTATTTVTGSGASSFSRTNTNCTSPLAAGASCTNVIAFTPQSVGTLTATVTYTDSASTTPQTVALSGTGVSVSTGLTITPSSLTFPLTTIGTSAATQTITLKNSTSSAVTFTATTTLTGTNASSFSRTNTNCTSPLAAGASCTNVITFTPQSAGSLTATVTYTDSASTTPQTVALSGTGTAASTTLTITPSSLSFPVTTIGASDPAETVTLKNTAATAISSLSISIAGANPTSFTETQTCSSTLAVGASCTVSVIMAPQADGNLAATLQVAGSGAVSAAASLGGFGGDPNSIAPDANTYKISTSQGDIYIELQPASAPKNVANFLYYVNNGTYTSSIIHRVIQTFLVQGGGYKLNTAGQIVAMPTTTPVAAEVKLSNLRGTLATASAGTNSDQFFFNVKDNPTLDTQDGGYTVFAKIVGVQGVNVASDSVSLAVMDAISFDTVYNFASPFNQIPLLNYTDGAAVELANYVYINSITQVAPTPGGPATPVFSIGTGTYDGPQTITITDSTPGAIIYYYPFGDNGQAAIQYTGPFTISTSQYVVAYASAPGYPNLSYYNYEYIGIN